MATKSSERLRPDAERHASAAVAEAALPKNRSIPDSCSRDSRHAAKPHISIRQRAQR